MRQCASCNAVWHEGSEGGRWEAAQGRIEGAQHVYCPHCTRKREAEVQRLSAMIEQRVEARPQPAPVQEEALEDAAAPAPASRRGLLVAVAVVVAVLVLAGVFARMREQQATRSTQEKPSLGAGTRGAQPTVYWVRRGGVWSRVTVPQGQPSGPGQVFSTAAPPTTSGPLGITAANPASVMEAAKAGEETRSGPEAGTHTSSATGGVASSSYGRSVVGGPYSTGSAPTAAPEGPPQPDVPLPDINITLPDIPGQPTTPGPVEPPTLPTPDTPQIPPDLPTE